MLVRRFPAAAACSSPNDHLHIRLAAAVAVAATAITTRSAVPAVATANGACQRVPVHLHGAHASALACLQMNTVGMYAWYTAASFNVTSNVWRDVSGNLRNGTASGGGFSVGAIAGYGSIAGSVPFVQGATTSSTVAFAAMPPLYSICVLSRYGGTTTNKRIITGQSSNVLLGHWNSQAGWAYFGSTYLTSACVQVCHRSPLTAAQHLTLTASRLARAACMR